MGKMNSELKEMKYKMSADKVKEKQEQKLKLVEKERDWFRDEALRYVYNTTVTIYFYTLS